MKIIILALVTMALTFFSSMQVEAQGYIPNTTNGASSDTIGTASTNDTSYTFRNTGYKHLRAEFVQNSTAQSFFINMDYPQEIRFRYLAADSTLRVEKKSYLGWMPIPIITNSSSTNAATYGIPLRTGTGIFSVYGIKEE